RVLRGLRCGHVVGRGAPAPVSGGTMDETVNSRILGLGHRFPERVVTNQDLTRLMDTSEEWIEQRTGIRERRFISADMGGADLGEHAAREALREAGIAAGDLDLSTVGAEVAVIFGDGAGAAVLGPEPDRRRGILSIHLHSEGRYAEKLMVEAASSRVRPRVTEDMLDQPGSRLWPRMEGRYVFKHAVTRFPEVIREALAHNGGPTADLALLIPHQAHLR